MAATKCLYIIGNGFDLYHNLPTRYSDFKSFVEQESPDLFDKLNEYFDECELWQDFEKGLGTYNDTDFLGAHNNIAPLSEDFRPSDCYSLEDEIIEQTDNLVNEVKEALTHWVEKVNESLEKIHTYLKLKIDAIYLNFNYTETLTRVYSIPSKNIFYIHGSVAHLDDLVVGHNSQREQKDELDENGDSTRTFLTDSENAAKWPFFAFQKPVDEIIRKNDAFFKGLLNVDEVYILGHSLSEIDLPYFKKIKESICSTAKWYISFYKEEDKQQLLESIKQIGCHSYDFILISDLA